MQEFTPVTQIPSNTDNLGELLKEFMHYAAIGQSQYVSLSSKLCMNEKSCTEVMVGDFPGYSRAVFPGVHKKNTIILMFEEICDESVKQLWVNKVDEIRLKNSENKNRKKPNKLETKGRAEVLEDEDSVEKNLPKEKNNKLNWRNIAIESKALFSVIILLPLLSFLFVSYAKLGGYFKNNQDVKIINTINIPLKISELDIPIVETVDSKLIDSVSTQIITAPYAQIENFANGLSLEVYSLGKKFKRLPPSPEGYQIAKLEFDNGGYFTFIDHAVNKNILNATIDRDSGLYYQGFINLKGSGDFIFQLDYQSGSHFVNQSFKRCRLVLKIKEMTVFDRIVPVGQGQSYSMQNMAEFSDGLTPFSFWFTCNNLRGFTPKQDFNAYKDTSVTLYLKHPNENEITRVKPDVFFINLNRAKE